MENRDSSSSSSSSSSFSYSKRSEYHETIWADYCSSVPEELGTYVPMLADSDKGHSAPRSLMEVFRIKINVRPTTMSDLFKNQDGYAKTHISGAVIARSQSAVEAIYNQVRQPILKDEGELLLTGDLILLATNATIFYFDLMIHLSEEDNEYNKEHLVADLIHHQFATNSSEATDRPLREVIDGVCKIYSATLFYSVLTCAVQATVEVILIDQDNPVVGVFGLIATSNDLIPDGCSYDDYESVLFLVEPDESVEVRFEKSMPLLRSTVAAPLNKNLVVRAELYDHKKKRKHNKAFIAPTKIFFPVMIHGVSRIKIDSKILVEVKWNTRS